MFRKPTLIQPSGIPAGLLLPPVDLCTSRATSLFPLLVPPPRQQCRTVVHHGADLSTLNMQQNYNYGRIINKLKVRNLVSSSSAAVLCTVVLLVLPWIYFTVFRGDWCPRMVSSPFDGGHSKSSDGEVNLSTLPALQDRFRAQSLFGFLLWVWY